MKTITKLFAMILALTFIFTCAGCADFSQNPSNTQPSVTETAPSTGVTEVISATPEVTDPAPTEPKVTEPIPTDEPAPTEPKITEPTPTEPTATEPAPTESKATEPAPTEPKATEPAPTEPEVPVIPETNEFFNPNNYAYDINSLSIKPRYVYWRDGNLVAECFVINGFAHSIYNIDVKSLAFSNPDGLIAAATFGSLQGLVLGAYQYAVWTFTFSPDCISTTGASLSTLITNSSTSNSY